MLSKMHNISEIDQSTSHYQDVLSHEFETTRLNIKTNIQLKNGTPILSKPSNTIDLSALQPINGLENGFVAYLKNTATEVCHIGLIEMDNEIEISYGTESKFQKQGYMSEALPAIIHWLFTFTTIETLYARIGTNAISERILQKNGFKLTSNEKKIFGKLYKLTREVKQ